MSFHIYFWEIVSLYVIIPACGDLIIEGIDSKDLRCVFGVDDRSMSHLASLINNLENPR